MALGESLNLLLPQWIGHAMASLCLAGAINTAVTRTPLGTSLVLVTLGGRHDLLPVVLIASITALFITQNDKVIAAARPRSDLVSPDSLHRQATPRTRA